LRLETGQKTHTLPFMKRFLISAAHKSSGKTTVSIGLCAALRHRGLSVQPYKKGPDFIDPMWLGNAAGHSCYNLDFYTQSHDEIRRLVEQKSRHSDISLIEGNKGLYDGLDLDGSNSNAALAKLLETPVILVIDTRGMTRGVAPLILGYQAFDTDLQIRGVIFNHVGGNRHENKLRAIVEHYTDLPVIGAVHRDPDLNIDERHLGLMPSNEAQAVSAKIDTLRRAIESQVDLDKLISIAGQCADFPSVSSIEIPAPPHAEKTVRMGIARDEAFGFYYPGDLETFKSEGAELISIDTLNDRKLPEIDALFLGGGFPEARMDQLSANEELRQDIANAIEQGMPAYAECGGLMYLCRSISWQDQKREMVGIIPADAVMCDKPQGRGYVRLTTNNRMLWPSTGDEPEVITAHEFHYSRLENISTPLNYAYNMERGMGIDGKHDGIIYKNLLANYTHLRDTERYHWIRRFLAFVRQNKVATHH
jgi:cobyrinic acid a,c-diamide synthase